MEKRDLFLREQGHEIYRDICFDILDSMVDKVKVIDRDRNIIYFNLAMKEANKDIAIGRSCYCGSKKGSHCSVCTSLKAMQENRVFEKEEIIDGKVYAVKSSPVKDLKGNIYGAVEVYRDVTKERLLEREILSKNREMTSDLNFSKVMQNSILPKKGQIENLVVDYFYEACENLSGDMFDIFEIDDEHIGLYIADVAGHGVTTSMTTMFIRQTIRNVASSYIEPKDMLVFLHKEYCGLNLNVEKYFTIFYAVYNKKTKRLKYSNAGHNAEPILARGSKIEKLRVSGIPIIILFPDPEYEQKETILDSGDRLFLFTDGIIEAKNRYGEQFGMDRLIEEIRKVDQLDEIERISTRAKGYAYVKAADDYAIMKIHVL